MLVLRKLLQAFHGFVIQLNESVSQAEEANADAISAVIDRANVPNH